MILGQKRGHFLIIFGGSKKEVIFWSFLGSKKGSFLMFWRALFSICSKTRKMTIFDPFLDPRFFGFFGVFLIGWLWLNSAYTPFWEGGKIPSFLPKMGAKPLSMFWPVRFYCFGLLFQKSHFFGAEKTRKNTIFDHFSDFLKPNLIPKVFYLKPQICVQKG